jgi:hypothetical protein
MAENARSFVVTTMSRAAARAVRRFAAVGAAIWTLAGGAPAPAATAPGGGDTRTFDLPAGDAAASLREVARIAGREILFPADAVRGLRARALQGDYVPLAAARELLAGTGLTVSEDARTLALAVRPLAVGGRGPFTPAEAAAFRTTAARPERTHRGPLLRRLEPLLLQQARHLAAQVRPVPGAPDAADLPPPVGRAPSGEHGIRPAAHTAKGLALVARLVPAETFPPDFTPAAARSAALMLVRGLVRTHGADGGACADGRQWRHQWQSAYWAALTGEAAWLLWDDLGADDQRRAARMIADEADRFAGLPPPTQRHGDSKAEENAWNSAVLALAACQFPAHPRHALWRESAVQWAMSAFARPDDLARAEIVDGRPLRDWLGGANLHDDFTLENHRRVHPDYMACTYLLTAQLPLYAWAGLPPPAALTRNVAAIGGALRTLAQPDGSLVYPNGQDWGLRRHADWFEYHATHAALFGDAGAAALARAALDTLARMAARRPAGSVYAPGETKLSSDDAMALELPAHTYALLAARGEGPAPAAMADVMAAAAGSRVFPDGKVAVRRTATAFASMAWGAQAMGIVQPLDRDQLFSPESRSLVGHVVMAGDIGDRPRVHEIAWSETAEGLGVVGVLRRAGERIEQRFAFVALRDGRVLFVDRVTTFEPMPDVRLDLGTLGVLNDPHWPDQRGIRELHHAAGTIVARAADAARSPPWDSESPWLNLDNRFGLVRLASSGRFRFVPAPTSAAGRLEQRLHTNAPPHRVAADAAGTDLLAFGTTLFLPGRSAGETAAIAAGSVLLSPPGAPTLEVRLPDGLRLRVELEHLGWMAAVP